MPLVSVGGRIQVVLAVTVRREWDLGGPSVPDFLFLSWKKWSWSHVSRVAWSTILAATTVTC